MDTMNNAAMILDLFKECDGLIKKREAQTACGN
jgi:hypothetical protein